MVGIIIYSILLLLFILRMYMTMSKQSITQRVCVSQDSLAPLHLISQPYDNNLLPNTTQQPP